MSQNIRFTNEPSIINWSRTVTGEGTRPNRIVLRDDGHQFITHREILLVGASSNGDTVTFTHDSFENGHYFRYGGKEPGAPTREQALAEATQDFKERSVPL
jgi:hypothetical protein